MVGRVSSPPVVPCTPILRRYHEVNRLSQSKRHEQVLHLVADPTPLVDQFRQSVEQLAAGYDHIGTFRPKERHPQSTNGAEIVELRTGNDLASKFYEQQKLEVIDHPELNVNWVDYELSILSTPDAAVFDAPQEGDEPDADPRPAGRAIRADLLMANATDRTPVLGEVKVRRDKDPYAALIQLLSYIAHLSTPSQYARLRKHIEKAGFPQTDVPRFDGYLLLTDFGATPNTWLKKLMTQTEILAAALLEQPEITRHIRRLVFLDLTLASSGTLTATKRWPA